MRRWFAAADRAQRSRGFKLIATAVVVVAALIGVIAYTVIVTAPDHGIDEAIASAQQVETGDEAATAARTAYVETLGSIRSILDTRESWVDVAIGAASVVAVALSVIWLGLSLTAVGLVAVAGLAAAPLLAFDATRVYGLILGGSAVLAGAFTAFMRLMALAMDVPNPVLAVARNVLAEAVRMKISLVFIVLLVFGLASLPGLLDEKEELRYRVMTFLQYGTGGSFWIIALLTLFFATASLTGEQRDKVIWQTITKPVAGWQYLLGKWLGIVALNAVLLAVCGAGVFLFTEYLRGTPAVGEDQAYVAQSGVITKDRLLLETQVLTARRSVDPDGFYDGPEDPEFVTSFTQFVQKQRETDPDFARTDAMLLKVRDDLYKGVQQAYMAIEPGEQELYRFEGLGAAKRRGRALTLRYRIDAGGNRPDEIYRVSFRFWNMPAEAGGVDVREVSPGFMNAMPVSPGAINDDGVLELVVGNFDAARERLNPETMSFPPGGLEVSYEASGFRANFGRVVFVLWLKLAFLAMVAVTASTFLSFPVACMVAVSLFLMAEGAGYIGGAVENYGTTNMKGGIVWYKWITVAIATPVHLAFSFYADLRPTQRLVDGRLLGWGSVAGGAATLAVLTATLYGAAVLIFRRRELAIYSGH